ncbi:MAG: hypothetical protein WCC95_18385 [Candidatus Sulfotelmatobacter sp.]
MKTYVAWTSYEKNTPNRGFWDQRMLEDAFSREMWNPVNGNEFVHVNGIKEVPRTAGGLIVILHARSCAHERWADKLNDEMSPFNWVIVMLVSDEEGSFPAFQVKHRNMRLYVMMPYERKHAMMSFGLPNGYPTDAIGYLRRYQKEQFEKPLDWFFSGQDTTPNRHVFVEYAQSIGGMTKEDCGTGGVLIPTEGFTQGLPREEYYRLMARAKVAPCPGGAVAPDNFRLYEALEAGCVPIADSYFAYEQPETSYWTSLFGEVPPFPVIPEWRRFPKYLLDTLADWPTNANRIGSWWMQYKRRFVYRIENDINALRGSVPGGSTLKDKITVLISSSPIPSHPSPEMILETIASVRVHLPECEIIIMQDGIRPEQKEWSAMYEEYKRRLLLEIRNNQKNVLPIFFDEFLHQAEMTRRTLDHVKTPHILFMEHDTPLCEDRKIEWDGIVRAIESGWTESVRFSHMDCEFIHPEHMHLAIDKCRQDVCGVQLMRTRQYSQRPHVASVDYYRRLLSEFTANCRTFIEDKAYSLFECRTPFKLAIYTPDGHIKRSRDLNGRAGGPKFDDRLIY